MLQRKKYSDGAMCKAIKPVFGSLTVVNTWCIFVLKLHFKIKLLTINSMFWLRMKRYLLKFKHFISPICFTSYCRTKVICFSLFIDHYSDLMINWWPYYVCINQIRVDVCEIIFLRIYLVIILYSILVYQINRRLMT